MMRYASKMVAESVELDVGDMHVEGAAKLDVSGRGPVAGQGLGAGILNPSNYGLGGGHGGYGGGADTNSYDYGE